MSWFEAIVLGVVQGLTEFLPVSSSAHVLVISRLLGWNDPGAAFTAVMQIGTELAVITYFRRDIARIVSTWVRSLVRPSLRSSLDARMGWYVILGTIPIVVLGVVFADQIETVARNLWLVAGTLIGFGLILGMADLWGSRRKSLDRLRLGDSVLFGLGQALALIPGVSRSGATISVGLMRGYSREAATRYAFLLAIPAVLGSGAYEARRIGGDASPQWMETIVATVIAFIIGYLVIAWLLRYLATRSFMPFVVYRIGFGLVIIVLLAVGVIPAT